MRGPVTPSKMFARANTFTFKSNQLFHRRSQIVEEVSESSRCPDQSGKGVTLCSRHLSDNEPQMQLRMQYCRSSLISQLLWVLWCCIVFTLASVFLWRAAVLLSAKVCCLSLLAWLQRWVSSDHHLQPHPDFLPAGRDDM